MPLLETLLRERLSSAARTFDLELAERIAAEGAAHEERALVERDLRAELDLLSQRHAASVFTLKQEFEAVTKAREDEVSEALVANDVLREQLANAAAETSKLQSELDQSALTLSRVNGELDDLRRTTDVLNAKWQAAYAANEAFIEEVLARTRLETQLVRNELKRTDELINEVYRSKWWLLKRLVEPPP